MNKNQRIIFSIVITFPFPISLLIANGLDSLIGGIPYLSIMLPLIALVVGVYFLTFIIWENTDKEPVEGGSHLTGIILSKSQRMLLSLVITLIFPLHLILIANIVSLAEVGFAFFNLILISAIIAVEVYFLTFIIWEKTDQESPYVGSQISGRIITKSQRILITLVITLISPLIVLLTVFLVDPTGENSQQLELILSSIIMAVIVYFLTYLIWKKT